MTKMKDGDVIKCPACDEAWKGVVEDYVVAGRFGVESDTSEQCGWCDAWVRVVRDPDGSYCVEEDEDAND